MALKMMISSGKTKITTVVTYKQGVVQESGPVAMALVYLRAGGVMVGRTVVTSQMNRAVHLVVSTVKTLEFTPAFVRLVKVWTGIMSLLPFKNSEQE